MKTNNPSKRIRNLKNVELVIQRIIYKLLKIDLVNSIAQYIVSTPIIIVNGSLPHGAPALTTFKSIYIDVGHDFYNQPNIDSNRFEELLTFVLLHEILHIFLSHDRRGVGKEPNLWNQACDFMINWFIDAMEKETKQQTTSGLVGQIPNVHKDTGYQICYTPIFDTMTEEEIYRKIQSNTTSKKYQMSLKDFLDKINGNDSPDDQNNECGKQKKTDDKNSEGEESTDEVTVTVTTTTIDGMKYTSTHVQFDGSNSRIIPEGENQQSQEDIEQYSSVFEQAIRGPRGLQSEKYRGFIQTRFYVKVDWKTIMHNLLRTITEPSQDFSYSRPRTLWLMNPTMPYLANMTVEDKYASLAVTIDESGSISNEMIAKFCDVVFQSRSRFKTIIVIKHDVNVSWTQVYTKTDIIDPSELYTRRSCGGTSHKDCFNRVIEHHRPGEDSICLVIALTDMASDLDQTESILNSKRIPCCYLIPAEYQQYTTSCNLKGRILPIHV